MPYDSMQYTTPPHLILGIILSCSIPVMKKNSYMYRMTVDNKMTLSLTDKRVSEASHDIELLLYAYLLRYSKMESELKQQKGVIISTEQGQELQSLNVQTKVLVANTMITVLATTIGFCGYVTGAFGMNLDNTYWTWPDFSFNTVIGGTLGFIVVITKVSMILLRRSGILPNERVFTLTNFSRQNEVKISTKPSIDGDVSSIASLVADILTDTDHRTRTNTSVNGPPRTRAVTKIDDDITISPKAKSTLDKALGHFDYRCTK